MLKVLVFVFAVVLQITTADAQPIKDCSSQAIAAIHKLYFEQNRIRDFVLDMQVIGAEPNGQNTLTLVEVNDQGYKEIRIVEHNSRNCKIINIH